MFFISPIRLIYTYLVLVVAAVVIGLVALLELGLRERRKISLLPLLVFVALQRIRPKEVSVAVTEHRYNLHYVRDSRGNLGTSLARFLIYLASGSNYSRAHIHFSLPFLSLGIESRKLQKLSKQYDVTEWAIEES